MNTVLVKSPESRVFFLFIESTRKSENSSACYSVLARFVLEDTKNSIISGGTQGFTVFSH